MTEAEFRRRIAENPVNRAILARLPELALPDAWLVSGALFQTIWNGMTGRPPTYGIKDYDLFYFDPDVSWEAEDAVIRRCADAFGALRVQVEVRNQARVHLWYEEKFASTYPPLKCATDGIDRFLAPVCMVGVQPDDTGSPVLYAPCGLADLAEMIVRPSRAPNFTPGAYIDKARRWQATWPEITVIRP